jgi:hypothetical protein
MYLDLRDSRSRIFTKIYQRGTGIGGRYAGGKRATKLAVLSTTGDEQRGQSGF